MESRGFSSAPIAPNQDSMCFVFIRFDLRFQSEAHRSKNEPQLRLRIDSNDTIRFVALAEEQLALVSANGLHGISFG